jgi:AraC-like DNA-binding protein
MRYAFESNDALTGRLRMRIQECREENLHTLAAENAANFHLSSSQSSRKFQEAFRKMKATFGNG